MVRRDNSPDPFHALLRANRVLALALLWAALAACVIGSLAFDVADWLSAWREVSVDLSMFVAAVQSIQTS